MTATGKCGYIMPDGMECGKPTDQSVGFGRTAFYFCAEHLKAGAEQVAGMKFKDSPKPKRGTVFSGQVLKVGEPLPNILEDQVVWSNDVIIHKIVKNGTVDYEIEFAHPSKGDAQIDEIVREYVFGVVNKLPR
jgi:hypothetical protein